MTDPHWTPKLVAVYLEEAADTLRRLPSSHLGPYRSSWPRIVSEYWETNSPDEGQGHPAPPNPAAIDRMDEVLPWLQWLEPDDSRLVWRRANGRPWKVIAHEFNIARGTAWRKWTYALVVIAAKLNALNRKEMRRDNVATSRRVTRALREGKMRAD